jgi:hypothetical protein
MITLESRKVDVRSIRLINRTLQKAEILVREWVDCITWLQSEQYIDERIKERNTIEAKRAKTIFFAIEKLKEMVVLKVQKMSLVQASMPMYKRYYPIIRNWPLTL